MNRIFWSYLNWSLCSSLSVVFFLFSVHLSACGVERWTIKTGTDTKAAQIDIDHPTSILLQDMIHWPQPLKYPKTERISPYETQAYELLLNFVKFKTENDQDIHAVFSDDQGNTIIGEIPAVACVDVQSPFLPFIQSTLDQFRQIIQSKKSGWQLIGRKVLVRGVGFFDPPHGQTGRSLNGIELHPILDLQTVD